MYGGEAVALRWEWRGVVACVVYGVCPVEGGAFRAPACVGCEAMVQRGDGKEKKRSKVGPPLFIAGIHPKQLLGLIVPGFPRNVVKTVAVKATRSIVRPLLPSKQG